MATEFQLQVWNAVEAIPEGRVATYGMIAKAAGRPNTARYISGIISQHPKSEMLPWHRIVYSNGTVWIPEKGGAKRKALYKQEGIELKGNKIVNFEDVLHSF